MANHASMLSVLVREEDSVIIDCFEVFIDRPSNLITRAQTFSNHKHHNTVKVSIGITPQATISLVSKAWGGRTSDKYLWHTIHAVTGRPCPGRSGVYHSRIPYV